jgi:hypothetical protein
MTAGFSTGFIITHTARMKPTLLLGSFFLILGSVLLTIMRPRLQSWAYTVFLIASSVGQGFSYPSTSLSMLATSVLVLFRSLGTVMGVAVSSLVVQNSLVHYLDVFVKGSDKEEGTNAKFHIQYNTDLARSSAWRANPSPLSPNSLRNLNSKVS